MCKDQFWSELFFHLKLSVHTSIHNSSPVYFTLVSAEHPPPFDQDHKPSLYDWLTQITQITHHKVISAFQSTFGLINTAPDYGVIGSNPAAKGSQAGNRLFRGGGALFPAAGWGLNGDSYSGGKKTLWSSNFRVLLIHFFFLCRYPPE